MRADTITSLHEATKSTLYDSLGLMSDWRGPQAFAATGPVGLESRGLGFPRKGTGTVTVGKERWPQPVTSALPLPSRRGDQLPFSFLGAVKA